MAYIGTEVVTEVLVGAVISPVTVTRYSPIKAVSEVGASVKSLLAVLWVTGGVGKPLMVIDSA